MVEAPGLFSTTTGWPHILLRRSASGRASPSTPPPGGYGTISFTARDGKSWAAAWPQANARIAKASAQNVFIGPLIDSALKQHRNAARLFGRNQETISSFSDGEAAAGKIVFQTRHRFGLERHRGDARNWRQQRAGQHRSGVAHVDQRHCGAKRQTEFHRAALVRWS